jgi:hypothetical protein
MSARKLALIMLFQAFSGGVLVFDRGNDALSGLLRWKAAIVLGLVAAFGVLRAFGPLRRH